MRYTFDLFDFDKILLGVSIWNGYSNPEQEGDAICTVIEIGLIIATFGICIDYN